MLIQVLSIFMSIGLSGAAHASIYGPGNLHEPYEDAVQDVRELARSSGGLFSAEQLISQDGHFQISAKTFGETFNICKAEDYWAQPSAAYCSAVLVAPDVVLTAGHCMDSQEVCSRVSMVFDFAAKPDGSPVTTLEASQVYHCAKVIFTTAPRAKRNVDYALIRLERPVLDRNPVPLGRDKISVGDELFIAGHPLGLPTKIAKEGRLRSFNKRSLTMSLSAFDHNSGSPIFDSKTGHLQGIYHTSFVDDLKDYGTCRKFAHYDMDYGPGEIGTNIRIVRKKLNELGIY